MPSIYHDSACFAAPYCRQSTQASTSSSVNYIPEYRHHARLRDALPCALARNFKILKIRRIQCKIWDYNRILVHNNGEWYSFYFDKSVLTVFIACHTLLRNAWLKRCIVASPIIAHSTKFEGQRVVKYDTEYDCLVKCVIMLGFMNLRWPRVCRRSKSFLFSITAGLIRLHMPVV